MCNRFNWTCAIDITANMHLIILIGFIALNCGSHAILASGDLPCDFLDSMNISDGVFGSNKTIVYKSLEFPFDQYVKINYTFDNGIERTAVAPYLRGCICNHKPCIRLCCPDGSIHVKSKQCQPNEAAKIPNVYSEKNLNDDVENLEPVRNFTFIHNYPCNRLYFIDPDSGYIITTVCILSKKKKNNENYNLSFLNAFVSIDRKTKKV